MTFEEWARSRFFLDPKQPIFESNAPLHYCKEAYDAGMKYAVSEFEKAMIDAGVSSDDINSVLVRLEYMGVR